MFLDLAKSRFSSRKYLNRAVEKEKILMVLEAARIAPSAANKQPCFYYIVYSSEGKAKLSQVYHRQWFKEAPVFIIACVNHEEAWVRADGKNHGDIDIAIAIDHMTLQASDLGLGTCWICNFDVVLCKRLLNLPEYIEPVAIISLAYPADAPDIDRHSAARKKMGDITNWL